MRIIHRVSFNSTSEIQRELDAIGVFVKSSGLVTVEIDEDFEHWPEVEEWIERRDALDIITTKFSKQEIEEAQWLEVVPDWHFGYPQPKENSFGYLEATYDLTQYCRHCGVGAKQNAPFQMKSEPAWGRNRILQLNWVFDEYFVMPDVWSAVFKPYGVGCRSVLDTKHNEFKRVVQLVAENEVSLDTSGLEPQTCIRCQRLKYLPVTRGPLPAPLEEPSGHIVKTTEYFGSGASAYKAVLISQELASALVAAEVRGASVRPVKPAQNSISK